MDDGMVLGTGLGVVFPLDNGAGGVPTQGFLLQEDGFFLLQEDGSKLIIT